MHPFFQNFLMRYFLRDTKKAAIFLICLIKDLHQPEPTIIQSLGSSHTKVLSGVLSTFLQYFAWKYPDNTSNVQSKVGGEKLLNGGKIQKPKRRLWSTWTFDWLPTYLTWTIVDIWLTTYLPHLVHVVCERPHILSSYAEELYAQQTQYYVTIFNERISAWLQRLIDKPSL